MGAGCISANLHNNTDMRQNGNNNSSSTNNNNKNRRAGKKWAIINGRRNWTCKLVLMTSARLILIIGRWSRNNVQVRLSWLILLFTVVASLYCRLTSCTSDTWSCTKTPASDLCGGERSRLTQVPRANTNTALCSAVHEKPGTRFIGWHQHFCFKHKPWNDIYSSWF